MPEGTTIATPREVATAIPSVSPAHSAPRRANREGSTETLIVTPTGDTSIRPFKFHTSEDALADLKRRIAATKWPDKELVDDATQGVQLATMKKLADYWVNGYDWWKVEARLDALPQLVTNIDGLDIHFIHVKSAHPNALPLIVTHGWPGSVIAQLKIIEPLTNPTANGGTEKQAFDVVILSIPGFGFSGKPNTTGWGPERIARAWNVLMSRLGSERYVDQGGDWGALIGLHGWSGYPGYRPASPRRSLKVASLLGSRRASFWRSMFPRAGTNRLGSSGSTSPTINPM
jgi:hypothetical protein